MVAVGACGVGDYTQIGSYLWHGICTLKLFSTYLSLYKIYDKEAGLLNEPVWSNA